MKSKQDELFELIKSLTGPEKRYFKVFSSRHVTKGENLYLELFDWMDERETYNEQQLKQEFKGSPVLKQLPVLKNYLKKNILKSLRTFHTDVGTRREVNAMIDYSLILIKKRLYNAAKKMIKKALKICWEHDQYDQVVFLEHMNLIINRRKGDVKAVRHFIDERYKEELKAIEYQKNHLLYMRLMLDFENHYEKLGSHATEEELKPLDELFKHPLLQDSEQALTFKSKGNFWDMHCKYYRLTGNLEKECDAWKNLIELHKTYPKTIVEFPSHYIQALSKTIELSQYLGDTNEAITLLEELYDLPQQYKFSNKKYVEGYMLQNYYRLQIAQMLEQGQLKAALDLAEMVKKDIHRIEKSDTVSEALYVYLSLAQVNLFAEQYQEALEWVDKLLYHSKQDLHSNTKIQAMLMSLILHYELGNEELIISLIRSYRRKLKAQKMELLVEFQFFSLFLKLLKSDCQSNSKPCFEALKENLMTLKDSKEQAKFYSYKNIIQWVDEKIKKSSINTIERVYQIN